MQEPNILKGFHTTVTISLFTCTLLGKLTFSESASFEIGTLNKEGIYFFANRQFVYSANSLHNGNLMSPC